jgi:hypothetical protein
MYCSSHTKEIRQCNCQMCRHIRTHRESFSVWGPVRARYRDMFKDMMKGADLENYNKILKTRDYDA